MAPIHNGRVTLGARTFSRVATGRLRPPRLIRDRPGRRQGLMGLPGNFAAPCSKLHIRHGAACIDSEAKLRIQSLPEKRRVGASG